MDLNERAMAEDIRIEIKSFDELTLLELHACLKLRGEVFVVGQRICSVADVDEHDPDAHHVMMQLDHDLVGTARLLAAQDGKAIKVGRIAVTEAFRGRGLGRTMMRCIQNWIGQVPDRCGEMSAQAYLQDWYEDLGWRKSGGQYEEAGIKHIKMFLPPMSSP